MLTLTPGLLRGWREALLRHALLPCVSVPKRILLLASSRIEGRARRSAAERRRVLKWAIGRQLTGVGLRILLIILPGLGLLTLLTSLSKNRDELPLIIFLAAVINLDRLTFI